MSIYLWLVFKYLSLAGINEFKLRGRGRVKMCWGVERWMNTLLVLVSCTVYRCNPSVLPAVLSCYRGADCSWQWGWHSGSSMSHAQRSVISSRFSFHCPTRLAHVALTWARDRQEENLQLSCRFASVRQIRCCIRCPKARLFECVCALESAA